MIRALVVAVVLLAAVPVSAIEDEDTVASTQRRPPRILVTAHGLHGKPGEIPDSIKEKNPQEIVVFVEPTPDDRHEVARYTVIPGEMPEWVCADWDNYHFHIIVKTPEIAGVRIFRDGEPLFDVTTSLYFQPPPRDPMDPEELRNRLEFLENEHKVAHAIRIQTLDAQFRPVENHWLNANCALEDNEWGITNEWVTRELDFELIKAQYPFGIDDYSNPQVEEFLSQWQLGDRLFGFSTSAHLAVHNEQGYLIVRGCKAVAKYGFRHLGPRWVNQ